MDGMYSTALALRAIIAIVLERTLGRFMIAATAVALLLAGLLAYGASHGNQLLWIIFALVAALLVLLLLATAATFFAIYRLLPRKLSRQEKHRISTFSIALLERLELIRAPLPLLLWHLMIQAVTHQRESQQRQQLQTAIEHSHSLNHQFKTIRGYFEVK